MDQPTLDKFTTYCDNQKRWWVITNFWYNNPENSEERTHLSIYLVGSNNEFKFLEIPVFKEFIKNRQFVLVIKK